MFAETYLFNDAYELASYGIIATKLLPQVCRVLVVQEGTCKNILPEHVLSSYQTIYRHNFTQTKSLPSANINIHIIFISLYTRSRLE